MPRRQPRLPPLMAEFDDDEREAVLATNRAFYRAFNERDIDAMELLWAPSGATICLHPGQAPLFERSEIMASWQAILSHAQSPRVRCSDEWVFGRNGLAMVVCREVLAEAQMMATNSFIKLSDRWHILGHHSGPVPKIERGQTPAGQASPVRDRRKLH